MIIGAVVGDQFRLALSLVHLKRAVDPVQLDNLPLRVVEVREPVVSAAELFFKLQNTLGRIDRLSEFRLQKVPQLRYRQLCADGIVRLPGPRTAVIPVLLVDDDPSPLQEGIDREPSQMRQPVFQAYSPISIEPVAVKKELPCGVDDLIRRHFGIEFQIRFGRRGAQACKDRAAADLPVVQDRFDGIPENRLIDGGVLISVQHGEQLFKLFIFIVASCRTEDEVPVNVHIAVAVIGLEVRCEGIVLCAVPDDVVRAPLLKIRNIPFHGL